MTEKSGFHNKSSITEDIVCTLIGGTVGVFGFGAWLLPAAHILSLSQTLGLSFAAACVLALILAYDHIRFFIPREAALILALFVVFGCIFSLAML